MNAYGQPLCDVNFACGYMQATGSLNNNNSNVRSRRIGLYLRDQPQPVWKDNKP
jgi:hypothetical protein